jgi:hypothetical protein
MERFDSQRARIGEYLKSGKSITPLEALNLFGAFRLSAVIYILKNNYGMDITTEIVREDGKRYAKYSLKSNEEVLSSIKDYLERGNHITEEVAEQMFNCDYLEVVVKELRISGVNVVKKTVHPLCGQPFVKYFVK